MRDLIRRLEDRAGRGEPRGADDVLRGARRAVIEVREPARPLPPARRIAAVAAAMLAVTGTIAVLAQPDERPAETAFGPTTTSTSAPDLPVQALGASSLVPFDDCASLLAELQAQARDHVGPQGLPGTSPWGMYYDTRRFGPGFVLEQGGRARDEAPAPSPGDLLAAEGSSDTNTQEVGVDEPDIVETDGKRLFVVRDARLRVVDASSAAVTATLPLGLVNVSGAVLVDDSLVVFANEPLSDGTRGEAHIVVVDVSGSPAVRERLSARGVLVDARVVNDRVHVVLSSSPTLAFTYPMTGDPSAVAAATAANRERIDASTIDDWLPHWRTSGGAADDDGGGSDRIVPCDEVRHPRTFAGFDQTTLLTLDLDHLAASRATAVVASSQLVYGSTESVYVATTSYDELLQRGPMSRGSTDIHRFALGATPAYAASGRIEGFVGDQFGFSEHGGHLRVASTTYDGQTETRVTVLVERAGELVTTGVVTGIGAGEEVKGVRFLDDLGYVVTFRQTDPLFVVDLRDPVSPRLAGQLEIPGYSAYLHPVGPGLLLGVGYDGTEEGRLAGAAVSLFDVSDPAAPKRMAVAPFGPATTPATENDHHAFTWWPETDTAYLPVSRIEAGGLRSGIEVVRLAEGALVTIGRIDATSDGADPSAAFDRVVVVSGRLFAVSPQGIQVSDQATLQPIAWVPLG